MINFLLKPMNCFTKSLNFFQKLMIFFFKISELFRFFSTSFQYLWTHFSKSIIFSNCWTFINSWTFPKSCTFCKFINHFLIRELFQTREHFLIHKFLNTRKIVPLFLPGAIDFYITSKKDKLCRCADDTQLRVMWVRDGLGDSWGDTCPCAPCAL